MVLESGSSLTMLMNVEQNCVVSGEPLAGGDGSHKTCA